MMASIERQSVADLCTRVDYGVTASATKAAIGPRFLRITDIQDDRVDWTTVPFCDASLANHEGSDLQPGDIVFARTGATTGKSFLVRTCPEHAVFASYLIRVRADQRRIEPRYLAWYFQTPDYWRQVTSSASGTAQPGVNASKLRSLSVPIRPLAEQRRIADLLDKADAIRRKRKEAIALTDDLLRSTFLDMFGDPVTNPKGWPLTTLGAEASEMKYGTSEKCGAASKGSLPVLRIPNVVAGEIDWTDLKFATLVDREVEQLRLRRRDLLFVRSNGNPDYIGRCAVFDSDRETLFASYLIRVRLRKGRLEPVYVRAALSAATYRMLLTSEARTTAGNYNISTEGLRRLRIPSPPVDLQTRFAEIASKIARTRRRLVHALVHGEDAFASASAAAFSDGRSSPC